MVLHFHNVGDDFGVAADDHWPGAQLEEDDGAISSGELRDRPMGDRTQLVEVSDDGQGFGAWRQIQFLQLEGVTM